VTLHSLVVGPLAHRVEQGTFNPKVPGSSPGRPTGHEVWKLGETIIPIPRHTELGQGLTSKIRRQCEDELRRDWWR
jgi:hypothetical protein